MVLWYCHDYHGLVFNHSHVQQPYDNTLIEPYKAFIHDQPPFYQAPVVLSAAARKIHPAGLIQLVENGLSASLLPNLRYLLADDFNLSRANTIPG